MNTKTNNQRLRFDPQKDKHVKYLFVSPFVNGGKFVASSIPLQAKIFPTKKHKTSDSLMYLFKNGLEVENMLIANACVVTNELKKYIKDNDIKVSFYEKGFFPHVGRWIFDNEGYFCESLLSKSRIEDIDINEQEVQKSIDEYKHKHIKQNRHLTIDGSFITFVMQHPDDGTIQQGFDNFNGFQKIIDWIRSSVLEKNEYLIVKMHPSNHLTQEKINIPDKSIAIQSKDFNDSIIRNSELVIGINSSLLHDASIIYHKPVLSLGKSWFTSHPEISPIISMADKIIKRPVIDDSIISYRRKMFYLLNKMQTPYQCDFKDFLYMHKKAQNIKAIEDWTK